MNHCVILVSNPKDLGCPTMLLKEIGRVWTGQALQQRNTNTWMGDDRWHAGCHPVATMIFPLKGS